MVVDKLAHAQWMESPEVHSLRASALPCTTQGVTHQCWEAWGSAWQSAEASPALSHPKHLPRLSPEIEAGKWWQWQILEKKHMPAVNSSSSSPFPHWGTPVPTKHQRPHVTSTLITITYFQTSCEIRLPEYRSLLFYFPEVLGIWDNIALCGGHEVIQ